MPELKTFKGLDNLAMKIVGESNINTSPPSDGPLSAVMQYWTSQFNISVVFATIFSSISIALFLEIDNYKIVSLPFVIAFIYFSVRTWAFARCARIACNIWK